MPKSPPLWAPDTDFELESFEDAISQGEESPADSSKDMTMDYASGSVIFSVQDVQFKVRARSSRPTALALLDHRY